MTKRSKTVHRKNRPYCRWKEFEQLSARKTGNPVVRNSGVYETLESITNIRSTHLDKDRFTGNRDFKRFFGAATTNNKRYTKNYVQQDPSPPPVLHKFRDEEKDKWVSDAFRVS